MKNKFNSLILRLFWWYVKRQIHNDLGYAISWHANIWACAYDKGMSLKDSNEIADLFMERLFDYDSTGLEG